MGSHYRSLHVRGTDQGTVLAAVEKLLSNQTRGRVLVGPGLNGWVGVYPNDDAGSEQFPLALSESLNSTVLDFLLHDSDVFLYNAFHAGKLVDEYSSAPDYFETISPAEHDRLKGRPESFAALANSSSKLQATISIYAASP